MDVRFRKACIAAAPALTAAMLVSCTAEPMPSACRAPSPGSITDLAREPDYSDGGSLERWRTADGCPVRLDVVMTRTGPEHCGFQSVRDIVTTWPPGSVPEAPGRGDVRIFLNDAERVIAGNTKKAERIDRLPDEAQFTRLVSPDAAMWYVPSDHTAIYLVSDDRVERWPAGSYGCA